MKQVIKPSIKKSHNIDDSPIIYTLLLDMNSIMKMALVDKRLNADGKDYGMIYQTLLQIKKQVEKKDYNFVYAMYDGYNSGQLRYDLYHEYKANRDKHYTDSNQTEYDRKINEYCQKILANKRRKPTVIRGETDEESFERQRGVIYECLEELFCRNVMCENVEGDDLIAYYVNNKLPNEKIVIVSGDRDLTQLISDDVCIYVTQLKKYITPSNHIEHMGFTHENVLIKKIMCGDSSDNIKGIKGLGEKTFFSLFPRAIKEKCSVEDIIQEARRMSDERKRNKQKPLQVTENIINGVSLGSQGSDFYDINDKIINLKKPLLTKEAKSTLDSVRYAPLDPTDRNLANVYKLVLDNKMTDLLNEDSFSNFFASFRKIQNIEMKYETDILPKLKF